MRAAWLTIGALGLLGFCACGGSEDNNLFQPTGGAAGKAGGASGKGGTSSGGSTSAGTGGTSSGGAGATAGGTGGSTAGKGGSTTGGAGGAAGGCAAGCDDGVPCTIDSCVSGSCVHVPGMCPVGQNCDVKDGCKQAPTCTSDDMCKAVWGADACKTNVRCDGASATCKFDLLDKDGDLHWPVVCGGDDCDDLDPNKHPGRPEICDGKDNDCDGTIDDGSMCPAPRVCMAGACACPAANQCGAECVDKQTSPGNCGGCGVKCPPGSVCTNGMCDCPGTQQACGGACVDTQTNANFCGSCTKKCGALEACAGGVCTCTKKQCATGCVDADTDEQNCGECGKKCAAGATCTTGLCVCPATKPDECGGACVDKQTDVKNCGDCGVPCAGSCKGGVCTTCAPGGIMILLDQSGSMGTALGAGSRLSQMLDGVKAFVQDPASNGLTVGVGFYPGDTTTSCLPTDYAPAAAMAPLPGNAAAILATFVGRGPAGGSVLAAPLTAAIDNVRNWQGPAATPGAVVIINDGGAGNTCSGEVPLAVSTAAAGLAGPLSVKTYVIGVGAPSATELQSWTDVAAAGGGTMTNTAGTGSAAIANALRAIRAGYVCP